MSDIPSIFDGLNEKQREAATSVTGPVLVIAGAGSGKTRALTYRIAYLIKECGVRPSNILAVTFTNKAAGGMRDRVIKLLGKEKDSPDLPTVGTFHSVCVRILRKHIHLMDYENQFAIYDDADQIVLMKHVLKDMNIDDKQLNPRAVLNHISNAKNKLLGPREFGAMAGSYFEQKVASLYAPYQDRLKKNNALDFDDLLMKTIELFRAQPQVLDFYQEKFKFIHVDEYQDTNHAQYILTNMLAAKYRNLCVIGDHDQSIYSWRGADLTNILDFEKDYPEAKTIKMEQNYRSTKPILDVAQAVIKRNIKRKDKTLWTLREQGEKVKIMVTENERHEAETVAEEIKTALRGHESKDYRDFVVLYRTNAQSRTLEEVFMRYALPYKIIGGIRFYERKEIKDLVSYLKVISNPADSISLLRIVNTPQRQIGPRTLEKLQTFANIHDCTLFEAMRRVAEIDSELPDAKREKVANFAKLIGTLRKTNMEMPASSLIKFVFDETGYKKFLDDGSIEGEARLENAMELISVASKYDKLEPGVSLSVFLEEIALISDLDMVEEKDNAVTLMTLHAAKGLEFPWVFICGLEDGLLPHSRSIFAPEELEEERRLFYVGCTRAQDRLFLLHAKSRMFYGETHDVIPSQFLSDIPEELVENTATEFKNPFAGFFGNKGTRSRPAMPRGEGAIGNKPVPTEKPAQEFTDGEKVNHATFGDGIVISVVGGIITVAFKNPKIGIKKLAIAIAPLEKI